MHVVVVAVVVVNDVKDADTAVSMSVSPVTLLSDFIHSNNRLRSVSGSSVLTPPKVVQTRLK